jgi:Mrp family chromosome partitioning ATPase/uncharacterized protein involved in exopolysaccharide biosynthesis
MATAQSVPPMDVRGFLGVLRRRSLEIVVVAGVVLALALAYLLAAPSPFRSRAQVEVRPMTVEEQLQPVSADPVVNMETEAARVTQGTVAGRAAEKLGLDPTDPTDLARAIDGVDVEVRSNTSFLDISCARSTSEEAHRCASAFATAYVADRVDQGRDLIAADIEATEARIADANARILALQEQLPTATPDERRVLRRRIDQLDLVVSEAEASKLSLPAPNPFAAMVSSPADVPAAPSRDPLPTLVVALLLGSLLGVVIALVRERLAEPVVDRLTFASALVAPVLAEVGDLPARGRRSDPDTEIWVGGPSARDAYRVAVSTVLHLAGADRREVYAFVGIEPGDATRSAAGFAVALAERGVRVVAISSDPLARGPHRILGVEDGPGMSDLLGGTIAAEDAATASPVMPGVDVVASGRAGAGPVRADPLARVIDRLRGSYDAVVIDTPALSGSVEALSVVALTDGVILVAAADRTLMDDVERARYQVTGVGGSILGGILRVKPPRARVFPRGASRSVATEQVAPLPSDEPAGHR